MNQTITIADIHAADAESISTIIEDRAAESDDTSSGIIGPSFDCSGPGSGWQVDYNVHDYAARALDEGFGALYYIDSDDGRMAEMGADDCTVEWTDESVIEIELPTVEEAIEMPDAWAVIRREATRYGTDEDELENRADAVETPYQISDGNATEYATTLEEVWEIVSAWYCYLDDDERAEGICIPNMERPAQLDICSIQSAIDDHEEFLATEVFGREDWSGHGNYYVSARARAGLALTVDYREA